MEIPQFSDINYFAENLKNLTGKSFSICKKVSKEVGENQIAEEIRYLDKTKASQLSDIPVKVIQGKHQYFSRALTH